jgi:hypothetical protein
MDTPDIERHLDHWHDDGSIILQVSSLLVCRKFTQHTILRQQAENMLYSVHLSVLKKFSPVFNDIFDIPPMQTGDAEGTIHNPMKMHQVTSEEMSDFLNWIYKV